MITVYVADTANSAKIMLALEELELAYKAIPINLLAGDQFDPAFVRLNPNAKVPVIVDDDGPDGQPHTAFESGAILIYLADKTGKLLPHSTTARNVTIQWLMLQMSSLGPMFGQFIHFARFAPPGNDYSLSRYRTQLRRILEVLEGRLRESEWLGGADYSIADIATFPWARSIGAFLGPEVENDYPKLMAWVGRIAARPAAVRADSAKAALASQLAPPAKMEPAAIDRLLGRGAFARA